ncbi:pyrethroid hydrolase Ces2e-like isoform 3-T4 [Sarcophilus harrisii]
MGKTFLLSMLLTWGVLGHLIPAQGDKADDPIRSTEYGEIRGTHINVKNLDKGVNVFLGIPFARPPIGALRFSPPQPPESWSEVKNATSYPPMCLQDITILEGLRKSLTINFSIPATSEDCLYLNIYVPDHAKEGARLPVMVWIHGGRFRFGSASMYDGSILSAFQNIVVVTIQFRLGILGFFSTGDKHTSGNWGYLDQMAAQRWIQENIAHFGGDPGLVTIFDESIGGINASLHVIAHLSACEKYSSASLVECLRNKTEREIMAISKYFKIIPGVINGQFFPKHPEDLLASIKFHKVVSIINVNSNEYGSIIPLSLGITKFKELSRENILQILLNPFMDIHPDNVDAMMYLYLWNFEDPKELQAQFQEMLGDFEIPALRVAKYQQSTALSIYRTCGIRSCFWSDISCLCTHPKGFLFLGLA